MNFAIPSAAVLAGAALLVACAPRPDVPRTGAADYARFCTACHGASGKGDGPMAASLTPAPTDLTTLSARNGGTFPRLQVMGRINGYTMGASDSHMPQFGELLENGTVIYDAGDGHPTETPARLVALVEYLEGMQE
ncbi:cytochrome c [Paracoccus sp. Z118]|uniref:c-type cytochrome n=1 Tax=Paracoccus sp. Z118 TaxID=2851017 RepID=UPI001C2C34BE|nr:cytochrome c [Paracoccus sp. Z118]MBV0890836.1 cytochrome c [Paracoccus sp. Z118]